MVKNIPVLEVHGGADLDNLWLYNEKTLGSRNVIFAMSTDDAMNEYLKTAGKTLQTLKKQILKP